MNQYNFSSELGRLRKELKESREREQNAQAHIVSIEKTLSLAQDENDQYRAWFKNHQYLIKPRRMKIVDADSLYEPKHKIAPVDSFNTL